MEFIEKKILCICETTIKLKNVYERLEIKFRLDNVVVESDSDNNIKVLMLSEQYSWLIHKEASRILRPKLLIILGIIDFFLELELEVFDVISISSKIIVEKEDIENICSQFSEIKPNVFKSGELDFSKDLDKIISYVREGSVNKNLSLTILDRLRKTNNLIMANEGINLYPEEAFLLSFGVIEMIANSLEEELKENIEKKFYKNIRKFYKESLPWKRDLEQQLLNKKNIFNDIFIREELNLKNKILFLLKKYKIKLPYQYELISELITLRDRIAHGNKIENIKFEYPLPAYFLLLKDSYNNAMNIYYLSSLIANYYFGTSARSKLIRKKGRFKTPKRVISDIIKKEVNIEKYFGFEKRKIYYSELFFVLVENKKIYLNNSIKIDNLFLNIDLQKGNKIEKIGQVFGFSVLLFENSSIEVSQKAEQIIKICIENDLYSIYGLDKQDIIVYLENNGVSCEKYKEYLEQYLKT